MFYNKRIYSWVDALMLLKLDYAPCFLLVHPFALLLYNKFSNMSCKSFYSLGGRILEVYYVHESEEKSS